MKRTIKRVVLATGICTMLCANMGWAAGPAPETLDAVTSNGEKVRLHPNGRWEFVDSAKAAEASRQAAEFPENKLRPVDAQGGLFGSFGRTIMPGDPDYNRGSLNPKGR
jgi:hypothetical protein